MGMSSTVVSGYGVNIDGLMYSMIDNVEDIVLRKTDVVFDSDEFLDMFIDNMMSGLINTDAYKHIQTERFLYIDVFAVYIPDVSPIIHSGTKMYTSDEAKEFFEEVVYTAFKVTCKEAFDTELLGFVVNHYGEIKREIRDVIAKDSKEIYFSEYA